MEELRESGQTLLDVFAEVTGYDPNAQRGCLHSNANRRLKIAGTFGGFAPEPPPRAVTALGTRPKATLSLWGNIF
jgi:hypothetical protein